MRLLLWIVRLVGLSANPLQSKSSDEAYASLRDFLGLVFRNNFLYTDNSAELIKAARDLGVAHGKALPYRPESNGVAERAVRGVVEGTRTIIEHSGAPHSFLAVCLPPLFASHQTLWSLMVTVHGIDATIVVNSGVPCTPSDV